MPAEDRRDPESLVRRIREGDPAAEEELVCRYRRPVALVLWGARRDPPAIDDLLQETFRIAIEKVRAGDLRQPDRLSGFLCSLARNLAVGHFRKIAARRITGPPDERALVSPEPSALENLLRSERAAIVRRVLS